MSSSRQMNKEMLNLLDKLEENLNKHKSTVRESPPENYRSYPNNYQFSTLNNNFSNYPDYPEYNFNTIQNNYNNSQISSSMEFSIRKIIKEEFTTLIIPYQQELHKSVDILEYKINNNIKHNNGSKR